jgi:hypothetical protein
MVIAQLSRLNMRLAALQHSRHALVETVQSSYLPRNATAQPQSIKLLDDAAFDSVAAWLAGTAHSPGSVSPSRPFTTHPRPRPVPETKIGRGVLHEAFSASHQFLEILSALQHKMTNGGSRSTFSAPAPGSFAPSISAHSAWTSSESSGSYFEQHRVALPDAFASNQTPPSKNVIRHLVMACHTLLLNFYVAVLIVLQHDANQPSTQIHAATLGQIRLVSVVQLCSYLIGHQHQAVSGCISLQNGPLYRSLQDLTAFGPQQSAPSLLADDDDEDNEEMLKELIKDVQLRLAGLKQTLCI